FRRAARGARPGRRVPDRRRRRRTAGTAAGGGSGGGGASGAGARVAARAVCAAGDRQRRGRRGRRGGRPAVRGRRLHGVERADRRDRPRGRPGEAAWALSQSPTAVSTAFAPARRLWSPFTSTTVRFGAGGGMPNGSRAPCTTSAGTATASS